MLPLIPFALGILAFAGFSSIDGRDLPYDREIILGIQDFEGLRAYMRTILETDPDAGMKLVSDPVVGEHVKRLWYEATGTPFVSNEDDAAKRQRLIAEIAKIRSAVSRG
jgi:hypothetical protein